jgi:hypothetical protein
MTFKEMENQLPPYVSYKTLIQLISNLKEALPAYFDTSYLSDTFSIITATQLTHALSFLNLINNDYSPSMRLKVLAPSSGAHHAALLRQVAEEAYPFVFKGLDIKKATYAELQSIFLNTYHMEDVVCRRCVKFFIELSADAGIPLSLQLIHEFE